MCNAFGAGFGAARNYHLRLLSSYGHVQLKYAVHTQRCITAHEEHRYSHSQWQHVCTHVLTHTMCMWAASVSAAIAVGAAEYDMTPGYGYSKAVIEPFSSNGRTPIYYDAQGNKLSRLALYQKPDVVGPDATDTSFFPPPELEDSDFDYTGFPNFYGESAGVYCCLHSCLPPTRQQHVAYAQLVRRGAHTSLFQSPQPAVSRLCSDA